MRSRITISHRSVVARCKPSAPLRHQTAPMPVSLRPLQIYRAVSASSSITRETLVTGQLPLPSPPAQARTASPISRDIVAAVGGEVPSQQRPLSCAPIDLGQASVRHVVPRLGDQLVARPGVGGED